MTIYCYQNTLFNSYYGTGKTNKKVNFIYFLLDAKPAASLFGEGNKLYCCEGCGCYGLYTEFLMDTRFCSVGCKKIVLARNEVKKKRHEDKLKELRLRRKKRKIKVLTQRAKRGSVDQTTDKDFGTTTVIVLFNASNNNTFFNVPATFIFILCAHGMVQAVRVVPWVLSHVFFHES